MSLKAILQRNDKYPICLFSEENWQILIKYDKYEKLEVEQKIFLKKSSPWAFLSFIKMVSHSNSPKT